MYFSGGVLIWPEKQANLSFPELNKFKKQGIWVFPNWINWKNKEFEFFQIKSAQKNKECEFSELNKFNLSFSELDKLKKQGIRGFLNLISLKNK